MKIDLNTILSSDHHFGHKNVVIFEPRRQTFMQLDDYDNHDDWLLYNWNSQIKKEDNVLHLGDLAFKYIQAYMPRLNGHIELILGNHDRKGLQTYLSLEKVYRGIEIHENNNILKVTNDEDPLLSGLIITISGIKIMFSHYPVFNENKYDLENEKIYNRMKILERLYNDYHCDINIHGHTHSNNSTFKNAFNVCIDANNYKIITLNDILNKM